MKNLREEIMKLTEEFFTDLSKSTDDPLRPLRYIDDLQALFNQAMDEVIGEDDNVASITHRVENVRTGYNLAKAEQRERAKKLRE